MGQRFLTSLGIRYRDVFLGKCTGFLQSNTKSLIGLYRRRDSAIVSSLESFCADLGSLPDLVLAMRATSSFLVFIRSGSCR